VAGPRLLNVQKTPGFSKKPGVWHCAASDRLLGAASAPCGAVAPLPVTPWDVTLEYCR